MKNKSKGFRPDQQRVVSSLVGVLLFALGMAGGMTRFGGLLPVGDPAPVPGILQEEKVDSASDEGAPAEEAAGRTDSENVSRTVKTAEGSNNEGTGRTTSPEPVSPSAPAAVSLEQPVEGQVVAPFGVAFSETFQDYRWHTGVDLAADQGTPVRAAAAGTVAGSGRDPFLGLTLTLDHGGKLVTVYGNLSTTLVKKGDFVSRGQPVGRVGGSAAGESKEAAHLHFEVRIDAEKVDPEPFF